MLVEDLQAIRDGDGSVASTLSNLFLFTNQSIIWLKIKLCMSANCLTKIHLWNNTLLALNYVNVLHRSASRRHTGPGSEHCKYQLWIWWSLFVILDVIGSLIIYRLETTSKCTHCMVFASQSDTHSLLIIWFERSTTGGRGKLKLTMALISVV